MILAIDIGGTKTLVALCTKQGTVVQQVRFATPSTYRAFLQELTASLVTVVGAQKPTVTVVAAPGRVDRKTGVGIVFGNLPWKQVGLASDISKLTGTKAYVENDANLAGLSEAHALGAVPERVLYITFSTGIGTGLIINGQIDSEFADSEGGQMLFEHDGRLQKWENFASGKAIVAKYGKPASEINDPKIWQEIAQSFAIGIVNLASVLEPDVIIIGGGVGSHFKKFEKYLINNVEKITSPLVAIPKIVAATAAEQAVIYGCIEFAKQHEYK